MIDGLLGHGERLTRGLRPVAAQTGRGRPDRVGEPHFVARSRPPTEHGIPVAGSGHSHGDHQFGGVDQVAADDRAATRQRRLPQALIQTRELGAGWPGHSDDGVARIPAHGSHVADGSHQGLPSQVVDPGQGQIGVHPGHDGISGEQ